MRKTSKTIVFFGNERLATGISGSSKTLQALQEKGYRVVKVFVKNTEDYDKDPGVPVSMSTDMEKVAEEIKRLSPDVGVLVAYGLIIPSKIIDLFPNGIINIHPSLLPKGRGPAPIEEVILDGSKETGVSIMKLGEKMDTGPLLAQSRITLRGNETKQELADALLDLGVSLLTDCLSDIFGGKAAPRDQALAGVTYTHKIKKSDGIADWNKTAEQLEREIRAYAGWPKSRAKLGGLDCIITEAEVSEGEGSLGSFEITEKNLSIFTSHKALLIKRLQPAGKREMSTEEFLRGYGQRLG